MATMNPFDVLDGDAEDPSELITAELERIVVSTSKKAEAQDHGKLGDRFLSQQKSKVAKMPTKPQPPVQALREAKSVTYQGGRGGGLAYAGQFKHDFSCDENSVGPANPAERGGPPPYCGGRQAVLSWCSQRVTKEAVATAHKNSTVQVEAEEKEEMTLEEYEKVLEERRNGLQALTTEERNDDVKEFESMQQASSKKDDDNLLKLVRSSLSQQQNKVAKMPTKPQPPTQASREARNVAYQGGRRGGVGYAHCFKDDFSCDGNSFGCPQRVTEEAGAAAHKNSTVQEEAEEKELVERRVYVEEYESMQLGSSKKDSHDFLKLGSSKGQRQEKSQKHQNGIQNYAQNLKEAYVNAQNQNKRGPNPTLLFDRGISTSTRSRNSTSIQSLDSVPLPCSFLGEVLRREVSEDRDRQSRVASQTKHNMSNHLPLEIVEEILHRLPVKSIVKCTSVCKAWNSLITHQTFIYDHLNRTIQAPNHNSSLFFQFCVQELILPSDSCSLLQEDTYSLYSSVNQETDQFSVKRFPLSHLFDPNRSTLFVGTCNGLVCSADYSPLKSATIIIWNPLLGKYVVLPKPITTCKKHGRQQLISYVDPKYDIFFGFGFDSRNNDYKVVRLMIDRFAKDTPHIEVYSLASHIWRSISVTVPQFFLSNREWLPSVFLSGALHWVVCRYAAYNEPTYDEEGGKIYYRFILSFDVIQETFKELTVPQQQPNEKVVISRLLPVEGGHSLAVVNHVIKRSNHRVFCIWVMKDYGITNSWIEIFRLDRELYGGIFRVLALTSNEKVLLGLNGGAVVLVDPTKESVKPVGLAKVSEVFVSSFVESLFFLNKEPNVLSF